MNIKPKVMSLEDKFRIVIESFKLDQGLDVEYTVELMEEHDVNPRDLARAHRLDSNIFDVESLVKVTMEWSYEQCHLAHGY